MRSKPIFVWSSRSAYAVGLITTDGCLSSDGRHIDLTSKDIEQLENFKLCLGLDNKISSKKSGSGKLSYRVQIGNVRLYRYLQEIGLSARKSKTIGYLKIPAKYFFDFLRGHFDGDGTFYSYFDPRWKNSFMFYISFISASRSHILWLRETIEGMLGLSGHISKSNSNTAFQLRYAKKESLKLIGRMYYNNKVVSLSRKRLKIEAVLQRLSAGGEMVYTYA